MTLEFCSFFFHPVDKLDLQNWLCDLHLRKVTRICSKDHDLGHLYDFIRNDFCKYSLLFVVASCVADLRLMQLLLEISPILRIEEIAFTHPFYRSWNCHMTFLVRCLKVF